METPIIDTLEGYTATAKARFHMPGHKSRPICGYNRLNWSYDVTELEQTDNLLDPRPDGAILRSQELAARMYGSDCTIYSCGGATLAIQTALMALCAGRSIVCDRQCHTSVLNAMNLCGITPEWAYADMCGNLADEAARMINAGIAGVFITSPEYRGNMRDITALAQICNMARIPLIVDNSHGSHLIFHDGGLLHPLKCGADIVIDSLHKTLPVMTGGALLHSNGRYVSRKKLLDAMRIFSSTSPSFTILASIDAALGYLREYGVAEHRLLLERISSANAKLAENGYIFANSKRDPYRMAVDVPFEGGAAGLYTYLAGNGVTAEYYDSHGIIAIPSIANCDADFALLCEYCEAYSKVNKKNGYDLQYNALPRAEKLLDISSAMRRSHCSVPKADCYGKIAARPVYVFPPSSCIIMPGEVIKGAVWQYINDNPMIDKIEVIE